MLTRSLLPVAVLGLLAAPAIAQESTATDQPPTAEQPGTLDDLAAHRLDDGQVQITFSYEGSACEEVGTAEPGEAMDGTLPVTFPTTSTAEVCTMQAVTIEVDQIVPADEAVTEVEVTLLATDGAVSATGTAPVATH